MKSIDNTSKGIEPQQLARWAKTCETMARKLCNDKLSDIILRCQGKRLDVSVKDRKSADCLVISIEFNLSFMPLFVQGVFTKLACDLRQAKLNS
jgi:hypothetical protein